MKARITESGMLVITPENETESFALNEWFGTHQDRCSYNMYLDLRYHIGVEPVKKMLPPKFPLPRIIRYALNSSGFCPACHSSALRKPWIFGKRYCCNPECEHYNKPIKITL